MVFLAGLGAIAYSYVGSFFLLARDAEQSVSKGDDAGAFMMIINFIMSGEIPQLTGFLYAGLLLIAVAVVMLIVRRKKNDN